MALIPAALAEELSKPLVPGDDEIINVTEVELASAESRTTGFRFLVEVVAGTGETSVWRLHVEWGADGDPPPEDVNPSSLVLTLRANIEEWWALRNQGGVGNVQATRVR